MAAMHILMSVNTSWNMLKFRRPLIDAFLAEGHRVSALVPFDDTTEELRALGVEVHPLKMQSDSMSPIASLRLMRHLKRDFAAIAPDIILSYTIKNNIFGAFAAKSLGIPFIPNITGLGSAFLGKTWLQAVVQKLYQKAFKGLGFVFFQNPDDRALFVARGLVQEHQTKLVPGSGISLDAFTPTDLPNEGPVFLQIGRLLREKGVEEFVEAARIVKADFPAARFQLLGGFAMSNRSVIGPDEIKNWQTEGLIEWLGEQSDVRPYIAAADCVVLASWREGLPRTLLEAGAMSRPLIATDVPGCRALVTDGENGYLAGVKDAKNLARAMKDMTAAGHETRRKMGAASRVLVAQSYDANEVVKIYQATIAALLGQAKP